MTPQPGTSGTGRLYEHTADGEQAAKEDVVIPHPDGDVVASLDEPPQPGETPEPTIEDSSSGNEESAPGTNEMPWPGDPADPENSPGR
jgi:hypothetical protein